MQQWRSDNELDQIEYIAISYPYIQFLSLCFSAFYDHPNIHSLIARKFHYYL